MTLPFANQVEIVRSVKRKKTITIVVKDGHIRVLAPSRASNADIQRAIETHHGWIQQRLQTSQQQSKAVADWRDKQFLLRGKPLKVKYTKTTNRWQWHQQDDTLYISGPAENPGTETIFEVMKRWYKQVAKEDFSARLLHWSEQLGVTYASFRVKEQNARWGSCSSQKNINLNWRLIQAPPDVIDYVVIHELCHLREMNHSLRFWRLVEQAQPDYTAYKRWLREHGGKLYF